MWYKLKCNLIATVQAKWQQVNAQGNHQYKRCLFIYVCLQDYKVIELNWFNLHVHGNKKPNILNCVLKFILDILL